LILCLAFSLARFGRFVSFCDEPPRAFVFFVFFVVFFDFARRSFFSVLSAGGSAPSFHGRASPFRGSSFVGRRLISMGVEKRSRLFVRFPGFSGLRLRVGASSATARARSFVVFSFFLLASLTLWSVFSSALAGDTLSGVASVIDAQRLVVGGRVLTLRGIDAPPSGQLCLRGGGRVACGAEARGAMEEALGGRIVLCRTDAGLFRGGSPARCWVDGADLGATMVASGWATSSDPVYAPLRDRARDEGLGLWAGSFSSPSAVRRAEASPWLGGVPGLPKEGGIWNGPNGRVAIGSPALCGIASIASAFGAGKGASVSCVVTSPLDGR
jgi:endonuclease YncB( thermonuclease family)